MKLIGQANLSVEHRIVKALLAGGLFLGLLILFIVPPANLPFAKCAFYSLTGHSCLTCGMTRSLHAISHGELTASFRYHLLGPVVFIGMLFGFMVFAAEGASGKSFSMKACEKASTHFIKLFAVVWLVYWAARLVTEFVR
jgi:hypothetical protein